jgi:hypothetical protein
MIAPSYRCDWCRKYFWQAPIKVPGHFYACNESHAKALIRRRNPNRNDGPRIAAALASSLRRPRGKAVQP